ncbi:hypothetical protein HPB47_020799 [Ixodes persulcatus]|uniref:Uncharacterized protein n=1 Tax=Ixodes persulcatus TaxID=34615 RepID=A0AC60QF83_IXOPE|nr:hypothetical protein HPB47_020799 [Ixodes persulcatus]
MPNTNTDTVIWQWNCRGYRHKQPVLRQHLRTSSRPPDVLILQETHDTPITLPRYQPFIAANASHGVSTLVRNRTTAIEHDLHDRHTEHLFIELIPHKKRTDGIFILNIYNTPSLRHSRFLTLFKKALNAAGGSPLVIGGDFNLPHTGWGYKHCSAAGRNLWQDSHDLGFTLITDPTFPTRLGTSTARDTTPDLTFTKNVVNAQWRNTQYDLGSDHSIIEITLPHLTALSTRTREFAFVDWDAFRKHRTEKAADTSITDIESWSRDLQSDTQLATRTIKTDAPTERMDSRLAHLIEAKTSILSRWKGQRLNKRLRKKILRQTANTSRLLKRVTNRQQGMKEESLIRLVHSFVICHVTYVAAFHDWYKAEKTKLDIIIRGAYKLALGLPNSTSTELLLQLGLHNTLDELIEAQRRSQLERLTLTETGRHILTKLGITYHRQHGDKHPIPRDVQTWLHADPIPKNMHPEYNKERRKARAASLIKAYGDTTGVTFVDAAEYQDGHRFAVATTVGGSLKRAASIVTQNAETAEEVAIALAALDPDCHTIVSDSRTAISNYIKGRISQQALRILHQSPHSTENQITLVWFPAHAGDVHPHLTNLNEVAHSVARGLVNRAGDSAGAPAERDRLTSYNDLTKSFYLERRTFPTPHQKLNRAQATTLRLLQTNTWQAALRSSHLDDQLWATQQACEAAKRQDLDVPTWEA